MLQRIQNPITNNIGVISDPRLQCERIDVQQQGARIIWQPRSRESIGGAAAAGWELRSLADVNVII
jgi:hypothetical protein